MAKSKKSTKTSLSQRRFTKKELKQLVSDLLLENPAQSYNYRQVANKIGVKDDALLKMISEILYELVADEKVEELYKGKFRAVQQDMLVVGELEMNTDGSAEVFTNDNREIFIPDFRQNHALHGDRVEVSVYRHRRRGLLEGEVIRIIERAKRNFVGTISFVRNHAFVIPDNKLMPYDIFIPRVELKEVQNGQKVIVQITDWPAREKILMVKLLRY